MKYITTDKHPELKEGIEIGIANDGKYYSQAGFSSFSEHQIKAMLERGSIKELQEKEFTKDEMIEFASWTLTAYNDESGEEYFDNWLKQRK